MKKIKLNRILSNNYERFIEIGYYIFLALLTILMLSFVLKLWDKDLTVPFSYTIDAFGPLKEVKNMILGNGLYNMPQLAAPLGGTEELTVKGFLWHFLWLKILTFFTDQPGLVINLYFLIGFPLTSMTSFWVLRRFNVKRILAAVLSIVYCFLPYHFYKGTFHIFYASYYLIPLACLVIICLLMDKTKDKIFSSQKQFLVFSIIICVLIGISDTYYGAFLCILLFFSGIYATFIHKRIKPLVNSFIYIFVTGISVLIAISPTIIYTVVNKTENVFSGERSLYDIELYSLKLTHLLLPMHGHRIDFLNNLRINYDSNSIMAPESSYVALGIIMALSFLISIFFVFIRINCRSREEICILGKINLFIILLCSIGGLNVFIGMFLTTSIRSYARIIVFLAFFSALAGSLILNDIIDKIKIKYRKLAQIILAIIILAIVIVDQTSGNFSKLGYYEVFSNSINMPYDEIKDVYESDEKFVKEVEASIDDGDMILQFPIISNSIYDSFPNGASGAYGMIRPFLHSSGKAKWSHGAQKGDKNDKWLSVLKTYSYEDIIKIASIIGFRGVYIDSKGFDQNDLNILLEYLDEITGEEPIISPNGDLYYYDLKNYNKEVRDSLKNDLDKCKEKVSKLGDLNNYYVINAADLYYEGEYKKTDDGVKMKNGTIQFGPYINLPSGKYKITLYGENLKLADIQAYTDADNIGHNLNIDILEKTNKKIVYEINSKEAYNKLECYVKCNEDSIIEKYEIEKVDGGKDLSKFKKEIDIILSKID